MLDVYFMQHCINSRAPQGELRRKPNLSCPARIVFLHSSLLQSKGDNDCFDTLVEVRFYYIIPTHGLN